MCEQENHLNPTAKPYVPQGNGTNTLNKPEQWKNGSTSITKAPDAGNLIPEAESVHLLVHHLPANCTPRMLADSIRDYGRIWSLKVSPNPPLHFFRTRMHGRPAAAARRFYLNAEHHGFLFVGGRRARVSYHPWRIAGKEQRQLQHKSRCLLVHGDPDFINGDSLLVFLRSRLLFLADKSLADIRTNEVEVRHRYITARGSIVELRFDEGFYSRASLALDVLQLEDNPRILGVKYGVDPCAKPE
ncbi:hypothetical protein PG987_005604 [Apiospora arundinis]